MEYNSKCDIVGFEIFLDKITSLLVKFDQACKELTLLELHRMLHGLVLCKTKRRYCIHQAYRRINCIVSMHVNMYITCPGKINLEFDAHFSIIITDIKQWVDNVHIACFLYIFAS